MIVIPENTDLLPKFVELIDFFNILEEDLEWPVCEDRDEARQRLKLAQSVLISAGVL